MALNKVEICGVNTSTLPVLDQEEKADSLKIKAGDEEARNCTSKAICYGLFKRDPAFSEQQ